MFTIFFHRALLDRLDEEGFDLPDSISEHMPLRKRWFPVKQYRGGLVAV